MKSPDRVVFRELSMIQKIIADETWLEGERRGHPVSSHDPHVRENVCRVILRIGQQMREIVMQEEAALAVATPEMPPTLIVAPPTVVMPSTCLAEHHHHEAA